LKFIRRLISLYLVVAVPAHARSVAWRRGSVRPRSLTTYAAIWVFWFACPEDKFVEIRTAES
jgi:hypothetical protein